MEELLKAIEELKTELNKRIDLLEIRLYKENTLLLGDVYKAVAGENKTDALMNNSNKN